MVELSPCSEGGQRPTSQLSRELNLGPLDQQTEKNPLSHRPPQNRHDPPPCGRICHIWGQRFHCVRQIWAHQQARVDSQQMRPGCGVNNPGQKLSTGGRGNLFVGGFFPCNFSEIFYQSLTRMDGKLFRYACKYSTDSLPTQWFIYMTSSDFYWKLAGVGWNLQGWIETC